jgi:hypothetical protein
MDHWRSRTSSRAKAGIWIAARRMASAPPTHGASERTLRIAATRTTTGIAARAEAVARPSQLCPVTARWMCRRPWFG